MQSCNVQDYGKLTDKNKGVMSVHYLYDRTGMLRSIISLPSTTGVDLTYIHDLVTAKDQIS